MNIEVDIDQIVQKIDINKLVEENIMSGIVDNIDFDGIIDEMLEKEELKSAINKRVIDIIGEYISSEQGKRYIIDTFNDKIADSDILADEKVIELLAEFLRKKLKV